MTPHSDRRAGLLSVLLLVTVFLAGALTGAAILETGFASPSAVNPEEDIVPRGLGDLGLTTEQRLAIDEILAENQPEADSIVQASISQIRVLMEDTDAQVRALLTSEQLERYEDVLAQQPRIRAVRRSVDPNGVTTVDTIG
ncbi:MAG: hypothetical protein AAF389_02455 [Gemmatimonadota bacterium]